jgi:hypothetical protein
MATKSRLLFVTIAMAFMLVTVNQVSAQKIELSPFLGYETGAIIHTSLGDLHIGDGMDWGGSINVGMGGGRYVELSYSHLATYLNLENGITTEKLCDLATDYYSIGALQEIRPDERVTPYGLFTLGWVNYRPSNPTTVTNDYSNENKMHISLAGGVKINASEKIGFRLQARLLMPLYYAGTYFSAGTGGAGYGVSGGVYGVQGDFTLALVIKIK